MCFAEVRAGSRELRRDDEELREEPERQAVTTRVCRASGEMTFLHPLGTARALVGCSHRQDQAGRREYPRPPLAGRLVSCQCPTWAEPSQQQGSPGEVTHWQETPKVPSREERKEEWEVGPPESK